MVWTPNHGDSDVLASADDDDDETAVEATSHKTHHKTAKVVGFSAVFAVAEDVLDCLQEGWRNHILARRFRLQARSSPARHRT